MAIDAEDRVERLRRVDRRLVAPGAADRYVPRNRHGLEHVVRPFVHDDRHSLLDRRQKRLVQIGRRRAGLGVGIRAVRIRRGRDVDGVLQDDERRRHGFGGLMELIARDPQMDLERSGRGLFHFDRRLVQRQEHNAVSADRPLVDEVGRLLETGHGRRQPHLLPLEHRILALHDRARDLGRVELGAADVDSSLLDAIESVEVERARQGEPEDGLRLGRIAGVAGRGAGLQMEVARAGFQEERIARLRIRSVGLRRAQAVEEGRDPACFVAEAEIEIRAARCGVARNDRIDDLRTAELVVVPEVLAGGVVLDTAAPHGCRVADDRAVDDLYRPRAGRFETDAAGVLAGISPDQAVRHLAAAQMDADASDVGTGGSFVVVDEAMRHDGIRALQRHARRPVGGVVGGQRLAARHARLREQAGLDLHADARVVEGRSRRDARNGQIPDARVRMVEDQARRERRPVIALQNARVAVRSGERDAVRHVERPVERVRAVREHNDLAWLRAVDRGLDLGDRRRGRQNDVAHRNGSCRNQQRTQQ